MDDQNDQEDSKTSDKDITMEEEYFEYNIEWAASPRERNRTRSQEMGREGK